MSSEVCVECKGPLNQLCLECEKDKLILVYEGSANSEVGWRTNSHINNQKEVTQKMVFEDNNPGIFEFKEVDQSLTGILIKIQTDVGPQNSMLYTVESEGKPVNVWGTTILDQRMVGIKEGDNIKIIYKGLGEAKAGKNAPKLFQVLVDRPSTIPEPVVASV